MPPPTPEAIAERLLARLAYWAGVQSAHGFGPVRDAWLASGPARGTPMTVRLGERNIAGAFAGLGSTGTLLLDDGHTEHAFAAGEVRLQGYA
jgi:BirA family biotin operon repressor/biotin-[acetyl-CoA-carboxylase] ligase